MSGAAIPKKIHYCWLSGDPLPPLVERCMESWRRHLPDYEIVKWDAERFDIAAHPFVREAFENRKWAFASDYIRLFAVHSDGGFYFDSDIMVHRNMDRFLAHEMVIPVEYHPGTVKAEKALALLDPDMRPITPDTAIPGIGLQAALFGGIAGHPFLKSCMAFYDGRHFIGPDGAFFTDPIAPGIYARIAEDYGFVYADRRQDLRDGLTVIESKLIASSPQTASRHAYAVHCCDGGWRDRPGRSPLVRALAASRNALRRFAL